MASLRPPSAGGGGGGGGSGLGSRSSSYNNLAEKEPIPHIRIEDEDAMKANYELDKVLGKGSFGTVRLATDIHSRVQYAIKRVNKEKAGTMGLKLLQREVDILKNVSHPAIISLHFIYETARSMFLVLEYCDLGDLKRQLKARRRFPEPEAVLILTELVEAVNYLHNQAIVHRDLKLENILCKCNQQSQHTPTRVPERRKSDLRLSFDIKLIDFGLSVKKDGQDSMIDTWVGTPLYMAPEIIKNWGYSHLCDVWSIGVIFYYLLSGQPPFYSEYEDELYDMIAEGTLDFNKSSIWLEVSDAAKHLLGKMMRVDSAHRYSAGEVLDHPCITGEAWDDARGEPRNVLEMMKTWKDEDLEEDKTEEVATSTSRPSITIETLLATAAASSNHHRVSPTSKDPPPPQEEDESSPENDHSTRDDFPSSSAGKQRGSISKGKSATPLSTSTKRPTRSPPALKTSSSSSKLSTLAYQLDRNETSSDFLARMATPKSAMPPKNRALARRLAGVTTPSGIPLHPSSNNLAGRRRFSPNRSVKPHFIPPSTNVLTMEVQNGSSKKTRKSKSPNN